MIAPFTRGQAGCGDLRARSSLQIQLRLLHTVKLSVTALIDAVLVYTHRPYLAKVSSRFTESQG